MVEFFYRSGIVAIGSRLRRLADLVTHDAAELYKLYGVDIKPKWFPVLYMLLDSDDGRLTVTGIARSIGQTHPSVSIIVRELKDAGLVSDEKGNSDRRSTVVCLTEKGRALNKSLKKACDDVERVVSAIEADSEHKLWQALDNWESRLIEKSLMSRVADVRKRVSGSCDVEVVEYKPEFLQVFKRLNIMWINSYWSLEPHDLEVLNDPETSILSNGGYILVALVGGKPMGVVSLCRMDDPVYDYELAKLAVDPDARGKGVGEIICLAAINKARELGAKRLFLESNTILRPAISLYRKLGFKELEEMHPSYDRGDIQMELVL